LKSEIALHAAIAEMKSFATRHYDQKHVN